MTTSVHMIKARNYFPAGRLPLTVRYQNHHLAVGLHAHDFTELVIITGGSGRHVLQRDAYPIAAGDVFVITQEMIHGYAETKDLGLINILFRPAPLHLPKAELNKLPGYHALFMLEPKYRKQHNFQSHLRLPIRALTHVTGLAGDLHQELTRQAAGFELMATALFLQLLGFLARQYEEVKSPDTRALLRISSGISYLENHYPQEITLKTLGEITHQSTRGLIAYFKSATGMAPIQYLIHLRIHRACELLRHDDLNITEVALRTGFSDSNYFSRQFHKLMGMSPQQFRARV